MAALLSLLRLPGMWVLPVLGFAALLLLAYALFDAAMTHASCIIRAPKPAAPGLKSDRQRVHLNAVVQIADRRRHR